MSKYQHTGFSKGFISQYWYWDSFQSILLALFKRLSMTELTSRICFQLSVLHKQLNVFKLLAIRNEVGIEWHWLKYHTKWSWDQLKYSFILKTASQIVLYHRLGVSSIKIINYQLTMVIVGMDEMPQDSLIRRWTKYLSLKS